MVVERIDNDWSNEKNIEVIEKDIRKYEKNNENK
jgi:hypothetical protein